MNDQAIKDMIIALLKFAQVAGPVFKADGFKAQTLIDLYAKVQADADLIALMEKVWNEKDDVGAEVKAINVAAGIDIVVSAIPEIGALISALSAAKPAV